MSSFALCQKLCVFFPLSIYFSILGSLCSSSFDFCSFFSSLFFADARTFSSRLAADLPSSTDTAHHFITGSRNAGTEHEVLIRVMEYAQSKTRFTLVLTNANSDFSRSFRIKAHRAQVGNSSTHSTDLVNAFFNIAHTAFEAIYTIAQILYLLVNSIELSAIYCILRSSRNSAVCYILYCLVISIKAFFINIGLSIYFKRILRQCRAFSICIIYRNTVFIYNGIAYIIGISNSYFTLSTFYCDIFFIVTKLNFFIVEIDIPFRRRTRLTAGSYYYIATAGYCARSACCATSFTAITRAACIFISVFKSRLAVDGDTINLIIQICVSIEQLTFCSTTAGTIILGDIINIKISIAQARDIAGSAIEPNAAIPALADTYIARSSYIAIISVNADKFTFISLIAECNVIVQLHIISNCSGFLIRRCT